MQSLAKRVVINAANITGSGAISIAANLLPALVKEMPDSSFVVLLPEAWRLRRLDLAGNANICYVSTTTGIWNDWERLRQLFFGVRRVARQNHADVCLTLGDLPALGLGCAQVVFLQQSLLVYNTDELAGRGGWSRAKRFYLTKHFGRASGSARYIVVQTEVMAKRVIARYTIDSRNVIVIPQPVPQHMALASSRTPPRVIKKYDYETSTWYSV